jgi:broad specificity phosphatase PhoE
VRRVVLWRHGRTAWNMANRFQGQTDVPLDDVGREQARQAARLVAAFPPSVIVASDLQRARETAQPLAALTGLSVQPDPRLRELHAGSWQGRLGSEIEAVDGVSYRAWRSGGDVRAGGGESRTELADRSAEALLEHLAGVPDDGVLVAVTHGGTTRAALGRLLGLPLGHWGVLGGLANCAWSVIEEVGAGRFRLTEHNAGSLPEPVVGDDR